jgi:hypothetical protein
MVAPGAYRVRLTLGAWSQERPLMVRADPRVVADGMSPAAFGEQERYTLQARDLVTDARRLVMNVQTGRRRLEGVTGIAADTLTRLQELERVLVPNAIRYSEPALLTHITYLYSMSLQADQKISVDARQRLLELRRELRVAQERLPK